MRGAALVLLVLPLVVVACGGGDSREPATPTAASPPDPGKIVVGRALADGGEGGQSQGPLEPALEAVAERLGPTYADFAAGPAAILERALEPFETTTLAPMISQSVSQEFGLVAVRNGAKALAFPLRRESGGWKVETPGPITFQIVGPQPGSGDRSRRSRSRSSRPA